MHLVDTARQSAESLVGVVTGVVAAVAAAVPSVRLAAASGRESGKSRGEAIFQEAKTVKDQLGSVQPAAPDDCLLRPCALDVARATSRVSPVVRCSHGRLPWPPTARRFMSEVKHELDELFAFLEDFKRDTGVSLIIVLFVDDLDRCLGGRNVKVLEAIQLMLSIPGVPVLVFLAIDSRVVVASIEESFGEILRGAYISGWEARRLSSCFRAHMRDPHCSLSSKPRPRSSAALSTSTRSFSCRFRCPSRRRSKFEGSSDRV